MHQTLSFYLFIIFTGAAVLATLTLYLRQSLIIAYIILGIIAGSTGFHWISDPTAVQEIGHVGIIFLLFLLGLKLQLGNLMRMLRNALLVTGLSALAFAGLGYWFARWCGLEPISQLVVALSCMFSSTILGLKLLPTTVLHHQHTGEVVISVLLLQDIIAIACLLFFEGLGKPSSHYSAFLQTLMALPGLILLAYVLERYVMMPLFKRFEVVQEYVWLLAWGWCMGLSELASMVGLSKEIGAFIAGVLLATHPISRNLSEHLKPLRDFFLVMFFFAIGAEFHLTHNPSLWWQSLLMGLGILVIKPVIFWGLLRLFRESHRDTALEIGVRLGQGSEFAFLLAAIAYQNQLIPAVDYTWIQASMLISFIGSGFLVVRFFPTPGHARLDK